MAPPLTVPLDGRITSQNVLSGPLTGNEVMEIVSPGNASQGNTFQILLNTLAVFFNSQPLGIFAVAALPAAGSPGRRAFVTDALGPTFLAPVVGLGAVFCPVFDNGSTWVVG